MPRSRDRADHCADALTVLAAATQRPVTVVDLGAGHAIRVDFEYSRYLLATNAAVLGPATAATPADRWAVCFYQEVADDPVVLVAVEGEWLVDAFDLALVELARTGHRIEADLELGELRGARRVATSLSGRMSHALGPIDPV